LQSNLPRTIAEQLAVSLLFLPDIRQKNSKEFFLGYEELPSGNSEIFFFSYEEKKRAVT
jgi:hypothetical protein